jgi:hypothetical protein
MKDRCLTRYQPQRVVIDNKSVMGVVCATAIVAGVMMVAMPTNSQLRQVDRRARRYRNLPTPQQALGIWGCFGRHLLLGIFVHSDWLMLRGCHTVWLVRNEHRSTDPANVKWQKTIRTKYCPNAVCFFSTLNSFTLLSCYVNFQEVTTCLGMFESFLRVASFIDCWRH